MNYKFEERMFLIKTYIKLENITSVQHAWRSKYKNLQAPSSKTIINMVSSFEKTGSVMPRMGRKPGATEKRKQAGILLKQEFAENPSLPLGKAACIAEISKSLARTVVRDDLGLKPYKPQYVQELLPLDYAKRLEFAQWFLAQPAEIQQYLLFSDEAYFYKTRSLNKQNNREWLESNPHTWVEKPLQDERILVWCAICANRLIGPYFFSANVNQHNYLDMLQNFF